MKKEKQNKLPDQPENESPFKRFERLAKKVVTAPKPKDAKKPEKSDYV